MTGAAGEQLSIAGVRQRHPGGLVDGETVGAGPDASGGRRVGEPQLATVDTATGIIYVTDFGSARVTVLDGSRCNATVTSGCGAPLREQAVGSEPAGLAVSPQASTVHVAGTFQAGSVSVLATDPGSHAN